MSDHDPERPDFQGTERFRIERRLGAGAFGVVYRAFDCKLETAVALKALRQTDPARLYRFKQEFRALADISHPNLVTLYELLTDEDEWFFTMELVEGVNFLQYVRGDIPSVHDLSTIIDSAPRISGAVHTVSVHPPATLPDLNRLRNAFAQLVAGVSAIHDAGKLHRDLKPSNVLVTPEGRVVILDFGLVAELAPGLHARSTEVAGTPAYMSPEQASGRATTSASDWYSVGLMLHEALTGLRTRGPLRAADLGDLPEDLGALCRGLLQKDPALRPGRQEILQRITGEAPSQAPFRAASLVGRESHLRALWEAFGATGNGSAVAVRVHGSSGMGKSTLVRHFLDELEQIDPEAVVLAGRCYDRESVPYKALDSVVDSLSQFLQGLAPYEVEPLLPGDIAALTRLFPVLNRVESVNRMRRRTAGQSDSNFQELRRKAFHALRDLLGRLANLRRVAIFIDDLQWGDMDSAALLAEILREPEAPAVLLVVAYRSEEAESSPILQKLTPLLAREVRVRELSPEEGRQLAMELLGRPTAEDAEAVAREGRGSPFFIEVLARHAEEGASSAAHRPALDEVIRARVARLPEPSRRLLEVVAVAGRPVADDIAWRAAQLHAEGQMPLRLLRTERLLRSRDAGELSEMETYHDRIREIVTAHLSAETLAAHHLHLARAYEGCGRYADPETLAIHYEAGGEPDKAVRYALAAAEQAVQAIAFDRAVRLYRLARRLLPIGDPVSRGLHVKLGDALANAGRGMEAAQAYLHAAEGAEAAEKVDLQRRGAEQLLIAGHIDEARKTLEIVLGSVGMRLKPTYKAAVVSLIWHRILLKLRGLRFRERAESEIPADELRRIDASWCVASGLTAMDPLHAMEFQARHFLIALRAGEPFRIARALCVEAAHRGIGGTRSQYRAAVLVAKAQSLADRLEDPRAQYLVTSAAGLIAFLRGNWIAARRALEHAEEIRPARDPSIILESNRNTMMALTARHFAGDIRGLCARMPTVMSTARERGDRFTEAGVSGRLSHIYWLTLDQPSKAEEELRRVREVWSQSGYHFQHFYFFVSEIETDLYLGESARAWERLNEEWRKLAPSGVFRLQLMSLESFHLRGRCAVALAAGGLDAKRLLRRASRDANRIERARMAWATPMAVLLRAGAASVQGDAERAGALLAQAEKGFEAANMELYAAAARHCLGMLIGGDRGQALVESVDAWMAGQNIRNPARMAAMLSPGRWS